jgi:hypothetical protein
VDTDPKPPVERVERVGAQVAAVRPCRDLTSAGNGGGGEEERSGGQDGPVAGEMVPMSAPCRVAGGIMRRVYRRGPRRYGREEPYFSGQLGAYWW